ncbi:phosphatidate cytidylyltransferase [Corticibacter populi]|uniref:Phosphatidate cytidylyltransferase n=1 Tax=Corticibacter populi TaxID=1550736 RepID=A0A3M6QRN0_9BURK|nr:phosphatidate cytidylyltransferase [Corticibacter populi]RMX05623.1 phosphatidate cytidylyltransferase [Corticibacter populi]RZS31105.1 phosphatidate cytidylyltransferase [Corticibacter populi]
MLKQRVITALVLLGVILACLFAPWDWPFVLLVTVVLSVAAWEWSRLNGLDGAPSLAVGVVFGLACTVASLNGVQEVTKPSLFWLLFSMGWLAGAVLVLRGGTAGWTTLPRALRLVMGLIVFGAVWVAVLRAFELGINYLLSLMALVWMADIGAYFAGRTFGQKLVHRKLAPTVSPGKSWEGVFGGIIGVLLLAALWLWLDRSLAQEWGRSFYGVVRQQGLTMLTVVCVALVGMSVLGDLLESLVKRAAGVKDSSAVLPGHGGVLDRIDGLIPVMPMGMLVLALVARAA